MRGRIVALLLPVLLLTGLAVVPQPASASATGVTCVEYLVGAVICSAPAAAAPLPVPYTRLDATAQATTPGSYAFLDATGHVVTTYEAMRDGTATRLRIHTSDADGTPHASLYAAVAVGDVVEWRVADDCWVRYEVTSVLPDPPATAPRKHLAVEWVTYAWTGCTGAIDTDTAAMLRMDPPPVIGPDITSPVRHGPYLLHPRGWEGELEEGTLVVVPAPGGIDSSATARFGDAAPQWPTDNPVVARRHPLWRDPDLPEGWWLVIDLRQNDWRRIAKRTTAMATDIVDAALCASGSLTRS